MPQDQIAQQTRQRLYPRTAAFSAVILVLAIVLGCGGEVRGGLEIDFRRAADPEGAVRDLAARYAKNHPSVAFATSSGTPLSSRLRGGIPPDAFMAPAGRSFLADPVYAGRLQNLTALAGDEDWSGFLPAAVKKCVADGSGWWMAPVGVRRSALLWFVPDRLQGWDAAVPRTWDEFIASATRLRELGIEPLAVGAGAGTIGLFEAAAISSLGADRWEALWEGRLAPDGPDMAEVWRRAKAVLDAAFGTNSGLPAGDPFGELAAGRAAFAMHDDAPPEGGKFASAPAPGTGGLFVFSVDGFALPRAAKNTAAARAWLRLCASREAQDGFNRARGAISVRLDSDLSGFDERLRDAALDYRKDRLVGSLARGAVAGEAFTRQLSGLLEAFLHNRDAVRTGREFAALVRAHGIAE